jgi:hypothetical protein
MAYKAFHKYEYAPFLDASSHLREELELPPLYVGMFSMAYYAFSNTHNTLIVT